MEETLVGVVGVFLLLGVFLILAVGWWIFEKIVGRRLTNATRDLYVGMRESYLNLADRTKVFSLCRVIVQYLKFHGNREKAALYISNCVESLELKRKDGEPQIFLSVVFPDGAPLLRIGEKSYIDVRQAAKGNMVVC